MGNHLKSYIEPNEKHIKSLHMKAKDASNAMQCDKILKEDVVEQCLIPVLHKIDFLRTASLH